MNLTDAIVAQQIDEGLAAADAHDGIAPIVGAGDPILRAPVRRTPVRSTTRPWPASPR